MCRFSLVAPISQPARLVGICFNNQACLRAVGGRHRSSEAETTFKGIDFCENKQEENKPVVCIITANYANWLPSPSSTSCTDSFQLFLLRSQHSGHWPGKPARFSVTLPLMVHLPYFVVISQEMYVKGDTLSKIAIMKKMQLHILERVQWV